ncbi:uncharacterized protein UV8b_02327 [Ustilaginoidea virens]|uniref:Uncharacterized protein n=1 Tax=Ustilaginoidea virens TaxID=1159556 RepID=A0A8E5HMC6_USTVR|nr:uncharacterized protein UV8b_02327 [Ustilaginoidea virens]QUC18086.1 hypothetical protein UV8b_02327 [Ustilaginoidea virens]
MGICKLRLSRHDLNHHMRLRVTDVLKYWQRAAGSGQQALGTGRQAVDGNGNLSRQKGLCFNTRVIPEDDDSPVQLDLPSEPLVVGGLQFSIRDSRIPVTACQ